MPFGNDDNVDGKVAVLLIGVGSAALVVSIYHCIAMGWCNRYLAGASQQHPQPYGAEIMVVQSSSIENSTAQLIPSFKYEKGKSLVAGDDEGTCAICLCEFEEGEELRTLPECMHTYHAACIDMWLYSHSNCPMCRTDATPSPQVVLLRTDSGYQDPGMLQDVVTHPATM